MSMTVEPHPTAATESERTALARVEQVLANQDQAGTLTIVCADGTAVPLPSPLIPLVRQLAHALAEDRVVSIHTSSRELTTQQAADMLNVSRPFFISHILGTGQLPYHTVGTHRRIAFDDLMAYKQQRDAERRRALRELSQASQQIGLE